MIRFDRHRALAVLLLLTLLLLLTHSWWGSRLQTALAPLYFLKLQYTLSQSDDVEVSGTYVITEPLRIRTGQHIHGHATFIADGIAFIAEGVHGWQLEGVTVRGSSGTEQRTGTGLLIRTANRYRVTNVTFEGLQTGVLIDPVIDDKVYPAHDSFHPYVRGDQGHYSNVAFYENTIGLQIDTGTNAEYNIFTNLMAANNDLALKIGAGNNIFAGFSIVDNKSGAWLTGNSPNHAHGVFSGGNINHNTDFNVKITDVSQGQTFTGVHIYGDGKDKGRIIIENSKDIRFYGGAIKAIIENNKGAGTGNGVNVIAGNLLAAPLTAKAGDDQGNLRFEGNLTSRR